MSQVRVHKRQLQTVQNLTALAKQRQKGQEQITFTAKLSSSTRQIWQKYVLEAWHGILLPLSLFFVIWILTAARQTAELLKRARPQVRHTDKPNHNPNKQGNCEWMVSEENFDPICLSLCPLVTRTNGQSLCFVSKVYPWSEWWSPPGHSVVVTPYHNQVSAGGGQYFNQPMLASKDGRTWKWTCNASLHVPQIKSCNRHATCRSSEWICLVGLQWGLSLDATVEAAGHCCSTTKRSRIPFRYQTQTFECSHLNVRLCGETDLRSILCLFATEHTLRDIWTETDDNWCTRIRTIKLVWTHWTENQIQRRNPINRFMPGLSVCDTFVSENDTHTLCTCRYFPALFACTKFVAKGCTLLVTRQKWPRRKQSFEHCASSFRHRVVSAGSRWCSLLITTEQIRVWWPPGHALFSPLITRDNSFVIVVPTARVVTRVIATTSTCCLCKTHPTSCAGQTHRQEQPSNTAASQTHQSLWSRFCTRSRLQHSGFSCDVFYEWFSPHLLTGEWWMAESKFYVSQRQTNHLISFELNYMLLLPFVFCADSSTLLILCFVQTLCNVPILCVCHS